MSTRIVNATSPALFGAAWGILSECERYRYLLAVPTGESNERVCTFILANPSTATPDKLDPTLTRCRDYAKRWGYGWLWVVNVRAWRETDPKMVPADPEAIGPENWTHIVRAALGGEVTVCGWGKLGGDEGTRVARELQQMGCQLHALRLNQDGSPAHPLYLQASLTPRIFNRSNEPQ